jgi:nitrogen fixation-related uncharacterized protein
MGWLFVMDFLNFLIGAFGFLIVLGATYLFWKWKVNLFNDYKEALHSYDKKS